MRSRLLAALALVLALAAALPGPGQAAVSPTLTPIRNLGLPERGYTVDLPRRVALDESDVSVWENGRRIRDPSFVPTGAAAQQFGVVLAVDASNSMRGRPLEDAFAAARAFASELGSADRIGLVTFNSRARVAVTPGQGKAALNYALHRVPVTAGGTRMYDAVSGAIQVLRAREVTNGSIVLLSDGADTGSSTSASKVAAEARNAHVRIFTVGLHSPSFESTSLRRLAGTTGGAYSLASSSKHLQAIFRRIGSQLAGEYVLRYRSEARPGELVHVFVEIAGQDSTRLAYVATGSSATARRSAAERFWSWSWSFAVVALLAASLLFAAVLALLRARRPSLRERIGRFVTGEAQAEPDLRRSVLRGLLASTERSFGQTRWWSRFAEELEIAGIKLPPAHIVLGSIVGTIVTGLLLALIAPVFALFALAVPLVARAICRRRLRRVRDQFAEQLPDTLQVLASALRAGHSFVGGLSVVARETEGPTQREFERVVADEQLGVPLEQSLRRVAWRMDSIDLEQIALVAELQRQTGGNMAEVLDRVVETVRGRFDLRRLVTTLTAQGRMARWIMTMLPVVLFAAISVLNPGYEAVLYRSSGGQIALAVAALMVIAGSLAIKRIVEIKV